MGDGVNNMGLFNLIDASSATCAATRKASLSRYIHYSIYIAAVTLMVALPPAHANETVNYTYDALGRVVQVARSGTVNNGVNATYAYDAAGNRSNVTLTGATAAAAASFAIGDASATEGGALTFTVTKAGTASGSLTVNYATANNTAVAGSDFNSTSGTLTFAAVDTSKTIAISTINDSAVESSETMFVNLSGASGGATISRAQGVGTIADNDSAPPPPPSPSFAVSDASATEGGTLTFTVTRNGSTSGAYTVNYASANGSATAGSDYNAVSGTLSFAAGETSKTVSVATTDDSTVESTETMTVNLSGASGGATIGDAQGVGMIIDNDSAPPPPPTPPNFAIGNATAIYEGGTLVYTVTRSGTTSGSYTVNFATANGSATAGSDYSAASGTLTFAAGETSKTINVTTILDNIFEGAETILVNLSAPSGGASITGAQGSGTINADRPPVAVNDGVTLNRCQVQNINVTLNDTDPDGFLPLTVVSVSGSDAANATIVSPSTIRVSPDFVGQQNVTYTVQDTRGAGASATANLLITVPTGGPPCP